MAITTLDGLLAGFQPYVSYRKSFTPSTAAQYVSMWTTAGTPAAGATPPAFTAGSGYECTNSTTGAIPFTNPVSGGTKLARISMTSSVIGTVYLYDRLWTCSGFDTTVTTEQNVTTPGTIPTGRDINGATLGDGVEMWLEVYGATGAGAGTWTVSYTNQAGTAGRSATYAHTAARLAGVMIPMTLQGTDTGVRAVKSITLSGSSGTAGNLGITLLRRIAVLPVRVAAVAETLDGLSLALPKLYDNSCLSMFIMQGGTSAMKCNGSLLWSQG